MEKLKRISIQSTIAAGFVALALAGCSGATPAAAPSPTATPSAATEPDRVDPAVELVSGYLEAIAAGDTASAWAMLSPETQDLYVSEDVFARERAVNGTVGSVDAAQYVDSEIVSHPISGPAGEQAAMLVEAGRPGLADAWVVRDTDAGPRVDDPGLPSTGQTPYEWRNPDLAAGTPFDAAVPVALYYPRVYSGDDILAEPPQTISGWIDGEPSTVTLDVAAGSGAEFVVDSPAASGQVVTVAWLLQPDSPLWRTSTLTLQ